MDKRTLLALVLSMVVLLGWYALMPQPEPPQPVNEGAGVPPSSPVPTERSDSAAGIPPEGADAKEAMAASSAPRPEAVSADRREDVTVETDLFRVVLTNSGARVKSWQLLEYVGSTGKPVELVPDFARRTDVLPLAIEVPGDEASSRTLGKALFHVERDQELPSAEGRRSGQRVRFVWADEEGRRAVKTLTFRPDGYLVQVEVEVTDHGRSLPVRLTWGPGLTADDSGGGGYLHFDGQAVYKNAAAVTRLPRQKVQGEIDLPPSDSLEWAGLEEQYFAALVLPEGSRGDLVIHPASSGVSSAPADAKKAKSDMQVVVAVGLPENKAQLFVGPKKYTLLRELGHDLESVVWFSSYVFIGWFARMLLVALLWIHDNAIPNYGVAIIVTTVALRLLLFPLNQYSMVNMKKVQAQMQRIQPKVNGIKAKYRKNKDAESRRKMNEEVMALYRKEGVNPMGGMSGCLPLLIQFPILIGFYNMLTVAVELRGAPFFGWIRDLTLKDPYYVTPVLMGATMFLQQKMSTATGGDPAQRRIMLMMPIVFTVMFLNLPSGLVLYWFVNNLLGIGQQWLVNRHVGRVEAAAQKV